MIVKKARHYYGLHLIPTAITDTSRKSPEYLRLDYVPDQLTSGKNIFKLFGNVYKFAKNAIIYAEVLDSAGSVVYSEIPEYSDSLNRRLLVINVTDDIAAGPALITIVSTLKDPLVPAEYRGKINFKWQTVINVAKFESNISEIIYETPPEVILQTRVRPFVTTSFRNNEEASTREYGDYQFIDYGFDDYVGDSDNSSGIFQKNDAFKKLTSFSNSSISSFNRSNVYYLKPENYSAKSIQKNYPDLKPGNGFFVQFGDNIVSDGTITNTSLSSTPWSFDPGEYIFSTATGHGNVIEKNIASFAETFVGQSLPLEAGSYYLVSYYADAVRPGTLTTYLGYSDAKQSGSISTYVTASENIGGAVTSSFILRASNGGSYIWFGHLDGGALPSQIQLDNIQVRPLVSTNYDFNYESDIIGGYVKIHDPIIVPQIPAGYTILPTYQGSQIISGSSAYSSYIDFVLQQTDAAVEDRFKYSIINQSQISNTDSYLPQQHKIDTFGSNPKINQTSLEGVSFTDVYALEYSINEPYTPGTPLTMTAIPGSSEIYGILYFGGQFGLGAIYKYDTVNKQFSILENFPGFPGPGLPDTTLLYLESGPKQGLYGTTAQGGRYDSGSLYRYNTNNNTVSVLYSFGRPTSASGYQPAGPLMQASNGLLYGTTFQPIGSGGGYGTIYSYNTASGVYSVVHQTGSYGDTNLIELNGDLWGVTPYGGTSNKGSIFRYNISSATLYTMHSFNGTTHGKEPRRMILGSDNKFYGVTYTSDTANVGGVIFSYDSSSATFTTLASLNTTTHGEHCERPLLEDTGYLYGVCDGGGAATSGSIFRYNLSTSALTNLHSFTGAPDGKRGKSSLIRVGNSMYGTSLNGGSADVGAIFRLDRDGINRPFIEKESGIIYHRNSIVPYEIPQSSNLVLDYPRWTGPVALGGENNLYSIIELEIKNLEPLSGDISKVQLYAKPKGIKSEFVDLGVYPTTPVDVLLDNNYVNHVQHIDSPYRLTGYFKPTITQITDATLESSQFKALTFLNGWNTGSITGSYFTEPNFHTYVSISAAPQINLDYGSTIKCVLPVDTVNDGLGNGLAYAVYSNESIPKITASADLWEQISYNLFAAAPLPVGMDVASFNYYTASGGQNILNLNNILVYSGLVTKTSSISQNDIYSISPGLNSKYDPTGSSVSASSFAHPFTFNGKLGWKTDTYHIPESIASTQSLYPALFFEYNAKNNTLFNNTIDSTHPHIVEVSNFLCKEIGDRDYIRDKYWKSYVTNTKFNSTLIASASVTYNTDILMDSAKLGIVDGVSDVSSSQALGYLNGNKLVFQTIDGYKFYKNTPYVISFNAVSQMQVLNAINVEEKGDPNLLDSFGSGWNDLSLNTNLEDVGYWKSIGFDGDLETPIQYDGYAGDWSYDHKIELTTGAFEHYSLDNPISLTVGWTGAGGTTQTINDIKPFTTYTFIVRAPLSSAGPRFTFKAAYQDANTRVYFTSLTAKEFNYDFNTRNVISPVYPSKSKLRVFGVNSNFGVPFADQLATPEIGEFIGELEHKIESELPQLKNFGRIEMEFEAETDGFGYIAFESDLAATWYISDISVKPKDRIGQTPGVTRLFVKIPNDLVNKPLTFKVEYLNDIDQKAPYSTLLNDIVFTNVNEQQSSTKQSVNTGTVPTSTDNTNMTGPNTSNAFRTE